MNATSLLLNCFKYRIIEAKETIKKMEVKEGLWPASPSAQYYNSSVLSVSIMGVMETEVPITINHARAMLLLKDVFLPINPRFSSIMVLSLSLYVICFFSK